MESEKKEMQEQIESEKKEMQERFELEKKELVEIIASQKKEVAEGISAKLSSQKSEESSAVLAVRRKLAEPIQIASSFHFEIK